MPAEEQKLPTKEIIRVLWPFLKANKGHGLATIALMTVSSIANVLVPLLGKTLIEGGPTAAMNIADSTTTQQHREENAARIKTQAALLIATFVIYHAISCWGHLQAYKLGMFLSTDMIKKAVEALAVVPWEDTIQQNPAEYSQTLMQSSRYAGDTVASVVTNMYPNLIGVCGFAVMVLVMSPSLTLLFALVVAATQSLQYYRQTRIDSNSAAVGKLEAKTLAVVTNTIQRSALIRLFRCSDFILDKLDICAQKSIDAAANLNFQIHSNAAMGSGTTNCLFVLIIAIMLLRKNEEEQSFSALDIAMFFMMMGQLLNRVVSVGNDVNQMNTMLQLTMPFVKLMRRAEATAMDSVGIPFSLETIGASASLAAARSSSSVSTASSSSAMAARKSHAATDSADEKDVVVRLDNVGFIYNKAFGSGGGGNSNGNGDGADDASSIEVAATTNASSLRNISLTIKRGHFVGIVGASGGGKTTILRLIAGLLKATTGAVTLYEDVCMLEQGSSIVVGSVEENIKIGNRAANNQEVQHASVASGSNGFISQLPSGLQTQLENIDVSGLSGGQLQRICLARVFLSKANIVLFDEPTTGLDPVSTERFFATAMGLRTAGRTIILVTHEHHLVAQADVVVAVKAGEIVGSGSYAELQPLLATLHDHH